MTDQALSARLRAFLFRALSGGSRSASCEGSVAAVCRGIPGRWRAGDGISRVAEGRRAGRGCGPGPVVSGIGAAASAFGISAARAMGTSAWHSDWNRSLTASHWFGGKMSASIERAAALDAGSGNPEPARANRNPSSANFVIMASLAAWREWWRERAAHFAVQTVVIHRGPNDSYSRASP